MRARKLAVLDINDREVPAFRTGVGVARHFEVRRLRTWKSVQQDIGGINTFRPDIVLADIDFEDDSSVQGASFEGCGSAKPLGPLLALPYVASRAVWTFAIYSAHFKERIIKSLLESPWVLLPFGILFAKLEGRVFGSRVLSGEDEVGDTVEDQMKEIPQVGNPAEALKEALDIHNSRLITAVDQGRVRVTNGERLLREISGLVSRLGLGKDEYCTIDEDLHVEFYCPGYGIDRIQWISLCADLVEYENTCVNLKNAEDMLRAAEQLSGSDPAFQMAVEVVRIQDRREDDEGRPAFDVVASNLYGDQSEETRRNILWVGVLLANAHAWAVGRFQLRAKSDVYSRLGTSSEGHTYRGWFGARSTSTNVCQRTLNVPKLERFRLSASDASDFYLDWGKTALSPEDKMRLRHYLEAFEVEEGYDLSAGLAYLAID